MAAGGNQEQEANVKVREIMVQPVRVAREDATLEEVAQTMVEHRIGCLPIVDGRGRMVGIITEGNFTARERGVPFSLVRAPQLLGQWLGKEGADRIYAESHRLAAREIMTPRGITVTEDATLEDVLEKMLRHDIKHVPVVRGGIPVGMVARHDLLRLMLCSVAEITKPCPEDSTPTAPSPTADTR
jgi:CBS domain-containing protein